MEIMPLADRLVVRATDREQMTPTGIVLPDTAKEKPQEGQVVAVGPGRVTEDGKRVPMSVAKGDRVLFTRYAGTEVKLDGSEYLILREADVLGKMV